MMTNRHLRFLPTLTLLLACMTATGCASLGGGAADDDNPELIHRDGPRALVMVQDNAFSYRSGSGGASVTMTGPNGTQTYNYTVTTTGWGWDENKAQNLETYFRTALNDTGAFYVVNRRVVEQVRDDRALEHEGLQETRAADASLLKRPDLMLVCTLTKLEENAGGARDTVSGGRVTPYAAWLASWWPWGSASRATQRGECAIMVEIVDRATGITVASAKGDGYAVGTQTDGSVSGWHSAIFGSGSTSSYEGVDMADAVQRATIRAVNDVVTKIPANYFKHDLATD